MGIVDNITNMYMPEASFRTYVVGIPNTPLSFCTHAEPCVITTFCVYFRNIKSMSLLSRDYGHFPSLVSAVTGKTSTTFVISSFCASAAYSKNCFKKVPHFPIRQISSYVCTEVMYAG